MRVSRTSVLLAVCVVALAAGSASANPPTGAIFTTVADGSEVNYNIYAFKTDVYLDGGPGVGAPGTAAGLDDGTYVFQITDPSGGRTHIVHDSSEVEEALGRIAEELNSQYLIGYASPKGPDGRYHSIRVRVKGDGYKVRARNGYVD